MKPSTATVLALLRDHPEGLTQLQCLHQGGGFRLAGRVHELRADGYRITATIRDGYAVYRIHEQPRQLEMTL